MVIAHYKYQESMKRILWVLAIICIYLKRLFIRFIAYTCVKCFEIQFHFGLNGQLFDHSIKYILSIILLLLVL